MNAMGNVVPEPAPLSASTKQSIVEPQADRDRQGRVKPVCRMGLAQQSSTLIGSVNVRTPMLDRHIEIHHHAMAASALRDSTVGSPSTSVSSSIGISCSPATPRSFRYTAESSLGATFASGTIFDDI